MHWIALERGQEDERDGIEDCKNGKDRDASSELFVWKYSYIKSENAELQ